MTLLHTHTDIRRLTLTWLDQLIAVAPDEAGPLVSAVTLDLDRPNAQYLLAQTQLLAGLGAVQLDTTTLTVRVVSAQAGYLLRLLRDLLESGKPLVDNWTSEGLTPLTLLQHPFGAAVDLLAALDRRRLEVLPTAAPLRTNRLAVGLITRLEGDSTAYLLAYDQLADAWQLPGGHVQRDSSPRTTLLRALSAQLGGGLVEEPTALLLAEMTPPLQAIHESRTYGLRTLTHCYIFAVQLRRPLPALQNHLRWVREADILAGVTADQQHINAAPLLQLLQQTNTELHIADTA